MQKQNLIILSPYLDLSGGVVSFVKSLKGHWDSNEIYFFRGGNNGNKVLKYINTALEIIRFIVGLLITPNIKVFVNTSLNKKAYQRDQLYCSIANVLKKEVYLFIHGWENDFFQKVQSDFSKTAFFKSKKIFVLSKDFKNSIVETGYFEENVVVEQTIVDNDFINAFRSEKKDFKEGEINLLYLSRMEKNKGIFTVLEAFKKLHKKNTHFNLDIAGNGSDAEKVKKWIDSNQELPIYYHGRVEGDDKIRLFKKAHFYLLPTIHHEGLPISILEAITSGCIVFVTPSGGIKYFFKDKEMGFLLKDASPEELKEKIKIALKDWALLKKIAEENHRNGYLKYSPQSLIKRIELTLYG